MMTEEEQMEAALAASLGREQELSPPPEPTPPSVPTTAIVPSTDEPTIPTSTPSSSEKQASLFSTIPTLSDSSEPAPNPDKTTRIQFRFPEGGRPLVRRFNKTDTVKDVFSFVKGLRSDQDEEFELVFLGRRLLAEAEESGAGLLDRSIVDAGLANGSVTVEV